MNVRSSWLVAAALVAGTALSTSAASAQECLPPRILLVVDASSSMNNMLGGETKWQSAYTALETVLSTYPDDAQYGLMRFPGASGQCSTGEIKVEVAANTGIAILQDLTTAPPGGGAYTPAGQTLMAASQYAQITDPSYSNHVIFVTDGYQYCDGPSNECASQADCQLMGLASCPSCNSDPNDDGCYCVQNWPVLGAEALAAQGVNTYVVGFGESVNVPVLNATADAGGTGLPGCDPQSTQPSCYFQASLPTELNAALAQIMQQVVVTEACEGPCGLTGERTCTLDGWGDCDAPSGKSCVATCGKPGTTECINGSFTECSSEGECGGGGAGGAGVGGASGGAGGMSSGTSSANGGNGSGNRDDPTEEATCGCRVVGTPASPGGGVLLLAGLALLWSRRRSV